MSDDHDNYMHDEPRDIVWEVPKGPKGRGLLSWVIWSLDKTLWFLEKALRVAIHLLWVIPLLLVLAIVCWLIFGPPLLPAGPWK